MKRKWLVLPILFVLLACSFAQSTQPAQPTPAIGEPQIPESEIPRATLEEAYTAYQAGAAVFVDVRAASSYETAHIPGALSIPVADIEARINELDPGDWIITYCTWPNEESSARAAQILKSHGFSKVTPILGGFRAWEQAGYPVEPWVDMTSAPKVTRWGGSKPPTEPELRGLLKEQDLEFYAWSNGPFDIYAPHRHDFDKVLYCMRGSITFQLVELGTEYELFPGDRLDLPAGALHGAQVGGQGVTCLEAHV